MPAGKAITVNSGGMVVPGGIQAIGTSSTAATGSLTIIGQVDQNVLAFGSTGTSANVNLTFNLGASNTSSFIALVGTGTNAISFNSTYLNLNDVTNGNLSLNMVTQGVFDPTHAYLLIQGATGTPDQYLGLTIAANGLITGGLNINGTGEFAPGAIYGSSQLWYEVVNGTGNIYVEVVPEPSTWAMLFGGLGLLLFIQIRRRRRN